MPTKFIVVMSDHKHPKYFVARRMIGQDNFAIVCTTHNQFNAQQIAGAMNQMHDEPKLAQQVVSLKRKRA